MLAPNVTYGSDVEFFVRRIKGDFASAEGVIKGTKSQPVPFVNWPGYKSQVDNVLAEGNVPVARSSSDLATSVTRLRLLLNNELAPHNMQTVARAVAEIPTKYLQTENAKAFGCDPAFNCWTLEEEPVTPQEGNYRTAGFHIHVGYDQPDPELNVVIARLMDTFIGLESVRLEPAEQARTRRAFGYGRSGNFRHQPHGVEYRVLSSYFASKDTLLSWACHLTEAIMTRIVNIAEEGVLSRTMESINAAASEIQAAINNSDAAAAHDLLRRLMPVPYLNHDYANRNWGLTYNG